MAVRLNGWLEETFTQQLLLGRHWLQEKYKKKEQGVKSDPEREWEGLYHDNGSCLDITNDTSPDADSYLQIIQLSPLVLTDGETEINPCIAPECLHDFSTRSELNHVVAIRKYTIRYTSYGPPRDKLRFIIHAVDWVANQPSPGGPLKPLWSEDINDLVRQLHDTRAREHRRCLVSNIGIEEEAAEAVPIMDDANDGESQPNTQYAFGTQLASPIRPQPLQDEPQVLGVRSLEPVLAGNTQREEIPQRPAHAGQGKATKPTVNKSAAHLLSLLKKTNATSKKPTKQATDTSPRPARIEQKRTTEPAPSQFLTQVPDVAHRRSTQNLDQGKGASPSSPQLQRSTKRVREVEADFPMAQGEALKPNPASDEKRRIEAKPNVLQKLASECSWMKGFEFSRDALRVPNKQHTILAKKSSWYKSLPGDPFPDGNIPITILTTLHRLADEDAAMEGGPDSDDAMEEDPSPEDPVDSVDPSPEDLTNSVVPSSKDLVTQTSPGDTSPAREVSWSPTPEPPQAMTRYGQLPPDSSFEPPEAATGQDNGRTVTNTPSQAPILVDSSIEKEQSVPPSSPPVEQEPIDLDDDMDMEEAVPQGLGEDSVGGASEVREPQLHALSPPIPVVQVKETPYAKGKNSQIVAGSPRQEKQRSSVTPKNTSSGSVVHGTYNEPNISRPAKEPSPIKSNTCATLQKDAYDQGQSSLGINDGQQARSEGHKPASNHNEQDIDMVDNTSPRQPTAWPPLNSAQRGHPSKSDMHKEQSEPHLLSERTPVSTHMLPQATKPLATPLSPGLDKQLDIQDQSESMTSSKALSLAPGPTKRKLENSPSKRTSRHSKRREIKIVGFGEDSPASADPTLTFRNQREESLRKFREDRKSSISFESRAEFVVDLEPQQDSDVMEVDSPTTKTSSASQHSMSPRHFSLYTNPSPTEQANITVPASQPASTPSPISNPQNGLVAASSPGDARHMEEVQIPGADARSRQTLSVLDTFKAAYPEYTGDAKHFLGQCTQMLDLDKDDKMVPKWQWDDFIIRSKKEYTAYVMECLNEARTAEPYHRFYKDTIRDTIYQKGIIEGPATLKKALQQLNAQLAPEPKPTASPNSFSQKERRSRASLPSAFDKHKPLPKSHPTSTHHDRPRHSLPARPPPVQQTPVKSTQKSQNRTTALPTPKPTASATTSTSTRKPTRLSRLPLEGSASSRASSVSVESAEGSGDRFRDAVFSYQRLTSLTGSTKVDSRLLWPMNLAVRPSVEDMLRKERRRVDVLKWGDEL